MGIYLHTLTDDELLRVVDRSHPAVNELAARLERVLYGHSTAAVAVEWQQLSLPLETPAAPTRPERAEASIVAEPKPAVTRDSRIPRPARGPLRLTRQGQWKASDPDSSVPSSHGPAGTRH